ncbi:arsenate reductase/protein-tyrosine-phosphatase family protein [Paenibacillus koleovorans]|uniref:arsenate reductase/protein-tyrosine-phosphatase family protein n=1 Tax=Paenibacillus koleovorans TaxID=121608 RepID=UPI000FDB6451|nr:low molecular weight protein arginine phosphatase [Paenibacillus koleovorans]
MKVPHILFVCTGNTCRSPMAEGLFRRLTERQGKRWEIRSAGVAAASGAPVSQHTATVLQARGAYNKQRSAGLTGEQVAWADLILTMTSNHKFTVIRRFPESMDKTFTLKEFVEDDPKVLDIRAELGALESELQIKAALSERIGERELKRLDELERQLPDLDIVDPFGGSFQDYESCAIELERALHKLLVKLEEEERRGGG